MIASSVSILVIGSTIAMLLSGGRTWAQGESYIQAELDGQQAMRLVSSELREAMRLTVANDGRSVTYQLPRRGNDGNFITPPEADNVNRTVYVVANSNGRFDLFLGPVGGARRISSNVILIDPEGVNDPAYRPFLAGEGTVTREVTVLLVTQTASLGSRRITHRLRETIFLRNIPTTTR